MPNHHTLDEYKLAMQIFFVPSGLAEDRFHTHRHLQQHTQVFNEASITPADQSSCHFCLDGAFFLCFWRRAIDCPIRGEPVRIYGTRGNGYGFAARGRNIVVQINSVLTRRGIPLWVPAAGRHKALPLHGQNFPGHLYSCPDKFCPLDTPARHGQNFSGYLYLC